MGSNPLVVQDLVSDGFSPSVVSHLQKYLSLTEVQYRLYEIRSGRLPLETLSGELYLFEDDCDGIFYVYGGVR